MIRQRVAWLVLCLSLVACTSGAPNQPSSPTAQSPVATVTAAPASAPSLPATASTTTQATTIVLREAPANMGCDTIGIDYTSMTFHIDPTATEQVSAVTDTGVTLVTYWAAGFQPGAGTERVVRDAAGQVVVADGEVLQVPPAAYPRLHGYFVCLAPDKLYVLLTDPS
jgi:hypothetical protein